jgi:hypothetical protein
MIITMITIWEVPVYEHTRLSLYKATHSKYEITSKTSHTKKNIFKYHFNCKRWPTRCNYFWLIYLFLISPACFGRCLRPSSGALDCIYSFWYCPPILLPAGIMDEMELISISSMTPAGSNIGGQYHKLWILSSAPDDGRKHRPKHVELIRNK